MEKETLIRYWTVSSDRDAETMDHLFKSGDNIWSLFVGHLVIEKLLKALYVKNVDITPPFHHNLVRLAEIAGLRVSDEQKDTLADLTAFNIQARYPDYKMEIYSKCTPDFTEKWVLKIGELRTWLHEQIIRK